MTVEITDATFEREVGSSTEPVVVEFYATWCGNCRRIAPVLDELADEFASRVRLVKVNADENPELVSRFGVSSTPTLFVLAGGERVTSVVGAQPTPILRAVFDTAAGLAQPGGPAGAASGGCGCGPACGSGTGDVPEQAGVEATVGWVPAEACTLPSAEQPMRLAEFDELFAVSLLGVRREESDWLRLRLHGGAEVESRARDLAVREAECCSFFGFTVGRDGDQVVVDVRVPADKEVVLDGLAAQAEAALATRV
ncbi:thioredoxin family protein [Amycolatopsis keratiniphila]|uniref:thioredoxin family protein n=1 Tax=Amycolatopsis keratiniphila TaxID=129921 RepID=UPI00087BD825|nr:thioredoxin domain-containing protein [Amycolatopsis keratiniphila]SDU67099.1 thioredoxin [Amycolatopsis keratiniphila]